MAGLSETIDQICEDRLDQKNITQVVGDEGTVQFESLQSLMKAMKLKQDIDIRERSRTLKRPIVAKMTEPSSGDC